MLDGVPFADLPIRFSESPNPEGDAWAEVRRTTLNNYEFEALSRKLSALHESDDIVRDENGSELAPFRLLADWFSSQCAQGNIMLSITSDPTVQNPVHGSFRYYDVDEQGASKLLGEAFAFLIPRGFYKEVGQYLPLSFARAIGTLMAEYTNMVLAGKFPARAPDLRGGRMRIEPLQVNIIPKFTVARSAGDGVNRAPQGSPSVEPTRAEKTADAPYDVVWGGRLKDLITSGMDTPNDPWWVKSTRDVFLAQRLLPLEKLGVAIVSDSEISARYKSAGWTTLHVDALNSNGNSQAVAQEMNHKNDIQPDSQDYVVVEFPLERQDDRKYFLDVMQMVRSDGVLVITNGTITGDNDFFRPLEDETGQHVGIKRSQFGQFLVNHGFNVVFALGPEQKNPDAQQTTQAQPLLIIARKKL